MKFTRLLILTLAWPVLALATADPHAQDQTSAHSPAGSPSPDLRQSSGVTRTTPQRNVARPLAPGRSGTVVKSSTATSLRRPANDHPHSSAGSATTAQSLGAERSGGTGAPAIRQNTGSATVGHPRPQASFAVAHPSPATAQHRGTNPALVGGAASSASRNAGSLNGTMMKRRP